MRTLVLQSIGALLFLALGLVCLRVARGPSAGRDAHRQAWQLSAAALVLNGLHVTVQAALAVWAYFAGAGSAVYGWYLEWLPVANYSRTVLMLAFAILLTLLMAAPAERRSAVVRLAPPFLLLGMVLGGVFGVMEGGFGAEQHYSRVAMLDAAELILVLVSLFAALLYDGMNRQLWFALGVYAFNLALTVIWTAALTGIEIGWAPAPWQMAAYRCALIGAATGLAAVQLTRRSAGGFASAPGVTRLFSE
jgi:hypothetical protein